MNKIAIPPRIVRYAHESLCRRLGEAAEDIARISEGRGYEHGECYAEPIGRFDRNRELLDVVGWTSRNPQETVTVCTRRERETLREALIAQQEIEQRLTEEDPKMAGAKQQVETAKRRAQEIKRFLSDVDLRTGEA